MDLRKVSHFLRKIRGVPYCGAVIVAAGNASRMEGIDKILAPLEGIPVIQRTAQAFQDCAVIREVVIVTREDRILPVKQLCADMDKVTAVIAGGSSRQDSVAMGLAALDGRVELAAIQDGARPLVTPDLIERVVFAAQRYGGAVPAIPLKDTVKLGKKDLVMTTPDRKRLYAVQTPQVFDYDLLRGALEQAKKDGAAVTDDSSAVERLGLAVKLVKGDERNLKITTVFGGHTMRIGHGYDVHRLVPGRKLILGGVEIPYALGLDGHSDADVLLHAVMDALLGAAGLGDIGRLFPDTDDNYLGISSLVLLENVAARLEQAGYRLGNLDVTMIAQKPKLKDFVPEMVENIARTLHTEASRVNVKATTEEHLGFTGDGSGMACHAVCLLEEI